jgi:hypothetical protein
MITVPVLGGPELASAVNVTEPVPLPPAPEGTWIQGVVLLAVQAHPDVVVTVTGNEPPLAYPSISDPIDSEYAHPPGMDVVVGIDVVAGVGAAGTLAANVSGLVPPQFSISLPGFQARLAAVIGPE